MVMVSMEVWWGGVGEELRIECPFDELGGRGQILA